MRTHYSFLQSDLDIHFCKNLKLQIFNQILNYEMVATSQACFLLFPKIIRYWSHTKLTHTIM